MDHEISLTDLPRQPAAVVRARVALRDLPEFFGRAFGEVLAVVGEQGLAPAGPPFGRFVTSGDDFQVTAGFPLDRPVTPAGRVAPDELPGGTAATTIHTGSYDGVGAAYRATTDWLAGHGFTASGAPWECYLDGPDVPLPRTQVFVPCEPTS